MYHMFINLLKSRWGKFILSFILGFGIVTLFREDCKNANCFSFVAPKPSEVSGTSFKFGDACYQFTESPQACTSHNPIRPDPKNA